MAYAAGRGQTPVCKAPRRPRHTQEERDMGIRTVARAASLAVIGLLVLTMGAAASARPADHSDCTTIQDGTLVASTGEMLVLGYDEFGYNYQAHMFNGTYDSSDRTLDGLYWADLASADYADDSLIMKWSDPWLANVDCNDDGKLDRGLIYGGEPDGISKGWLTNQNEGDYTDSEGAHHYTYFSKIVWVGPGGTLWGQYEIIEEVINDPAAGDHGLQVMVEAPGFGLNDGWTTTE